MEILFTNGRFYNSDSSADDAPTFSECMVVKNGIIQHVGSRQDEEVQICLRNGVKCEDVGGRIVLPGFIDGHMHLLILGQGLGKLDLEGCADLDEIRGRIKSFANENPNMKRLLCKNWMHSMTNMEAKSSMIDDLDLRPIFIDSKDLHSTWCNTAAIKELDIQDMPDLKGGSIERDSRGNPTGHLTDAVVMTVVWPHIAKVATMDEKLRALQTAIDTYHANGYTGMIDMAMDENSWEALLTLRAQKPELAMRISAYWIITPGDENSNLAKVDRAIELAKQYNSQTSLDCRIIGIKIMIDGIIDACTAHLLEPYSSPAVSAEPFWTAEMLAPVVKRAIDSNLQVALHAIGDAAIRTAIDVLEPHSTPGQSRHRIEHLELTHPTDARRLGALGITASIQPVHSDPSILRAWPTLIGHRCSRAFAYREFADHGAPLAIGTDAPTAPHGPLDNVYVATTRKSARHPGAGDEAFQTQHALGLGESLVAASRGAAYSVFEEHRVGTLGKGMLADFVVCDMAWDKEKLLEARTVETWFAGRRVYKAN